jgi:hypothetical protein
MTNLKLNLDRVPNGTSVVEVSAIKDFLITHKATGMIVADSLLLEAMESLLEDTKQVLKDYSQIAEIVAKEWSNFIADGVPALNETLPLTLARINTFLLELREFDLRCNGMYQYPEKTDQTEKLSLPQRHIIICGNNEESNHAELTKLMIRYSMYDILCKNYADFNYEEYDDIDLILIDGVKDMVSFRMLKSQLNLRKPIFVIATELQEDQISEDLKKFCDIITIDSNTKNNSNENQS